MMEAKLQELETSARARLTGAADAGELEEIRKMQPKMILSGHLPAAPGTMMERLLESLAAVPAAQPFAGPDQAAFEQMLRKMTGAG